MDIAEVAKVSGLPASTIRFYEEKGLIQSCGRSGLRRLFSAHVIERLALISLGRSAGFSLDEIAEMFTPEGPDINRALLLAKADELDRTIEMLVAMRDGLRHAAVCKAPSHFECPKFLRLLRIAGKNRFRQPNKLKENKPKREKQKRKTGQFN
ncbi:helix-turn-helix domain-containing protein [Nitrosomonas sp. sh817]|uniref:helix-turn-helix domain-containing protein n=1 Tax=Nitrosomonas sp. sh817 TaxID=3070658 RepID=UPI0027DC1533|nr:helix-turn-helix domain-containing protein [Nitrosomonas sp. sh817]WMJ08221.1 helix-turn-helix domain-containing protein [Nitrosomonas sp. sh817]